MKEKSTNDIQLPLIHMNGNNPESLGNQYFEALQALENLKTAFYRIQFHSRDYYPLGDEKWELARANRRAVEEKIESMRQYLEVHAEHCFSNVK